MTVRSHETTVTFDHPFQMRGASGALPAGTYRVVIDDKQVPDLSFIAYRRVATMLHTPAVAAPQGRSASLAIDAAELDAALATDRRLSAESGQLPSPAQPASTGVPLAVNTDVDPVSKHQPHL